VAQGVSPKFKPQYHKKRKKTIKNTERNYTRPKEVERDHVHGLEDLKLLRC
jgi:hypothetical protein